MTHYDWGNCSFTLPRVSTINLSSVKQYLRSKPRITVLLLVIAFCTPLLVRYGFFLTVPHGAGRNQQIVAFAKGRSLALFAVELEEKKLISSARLLTLHARLLGDDSRVQAGDYQLNDGMKPREILRKLVTGDVYVRLFAVPEGYSLYQLAELLQARGLFKKEDFIRACSDKKLLAELGINAHSVEGYLHPGSYNVVTGMDEAALITQMVKKFHEVFAAKFAERAKSSALDMGKILTLASMIEKEAVEPTERPLIAAVFLNRLQKGMRLQSDPTAVYGVRAFAGKISKQDIMRDSPYNTYLIAGLPPGPIGNPGSGSLEAVLNPARSTYLYFVAKKDGTHYFSSTLAEHNRAVVRYLKTAAPSGTPTPRPVAEYKNDHPNLTGRR